MIKWVFFDVGDVLFSEDIQHIWQYHALLLELRRAGKSVTWDEWNETRIRLAAEGPNPEHSIKESLAFYCDSDEETQRLWADARAQYDQMRKPRPYGVLQDGMLPVLENLRQDFNLGIIANQHPPVLEGLRDYGVARLCDVIVISESVGLFKPDPAIFQRGLDEAGIAASEAIFVGDRPDNDIRPAKALGMRTVRFKRGVQYIYYNPTDPAQTADAVVESVSELAGAIRYVAR